MAIISLWSEVEGQRFDSATTKLTNPDAPCLSELVHHFLQDDESSAAGFPDNESDSDQVDSASDADAINSILRSVRGTFTFGKKDTSTDLYSICSVKQNKIRSHAIGNQEVASGIDDGLRFEHGGQVSVRAERPRIGIGGLHGVGRGRQNSGAGGDHRGGVAAAEGDISCDILLQICENSAPKIYWHVTFDFVKTQIKGDELSTAIALRDLDTCQSKLVRILLFYALDPIVFYEGEKPPGREILETSARNLLLSDGTKVAVKNKEGVETAQEPALHTTWPYGSRTENEWRDKE
ncbi:hypothetical protein FF1_013652 [Malus domestica]